MLEIKLTQNKYALIDDDDLELISSKKWHYHNGYAFYSEKSERFSMHNLIMNSDALIDHIDRNGLNNQKTNLRIANHSINGFNRLMPKRELPRGVSYHNKAYQASIRINRRLVYLGRFQKLEDARNAYLETAFKHFGEYPPE